MFRQGKYISGEVDGIGVAVCFSEAIPHVTIAPFFSEIWGAGFFTVRKDDTSASYVRASCFGKSVGLGVEADEVRDSRLVNRSLGIVTVDE